MTLNLTLSLHTGNAGAVLHLAATDLADALAKIDTFLDGTRKHPAPAFGPGVFHIGEAERPSAWPRLTRRPRASV